MRERKRAAQRRPATPARRAWPPSSTSTATPRRASASPRASIDDALYSAFGQRIVSTIFTETNQYRVILEAQPGLLGTRRVARQAQPAHQLGRADAARRDRHDQRAAGAAADHARRPVPGVDDRLRHRARRLARRRGRRDPRRRQGDRPAGVGAAHLPRRLGRLRAVAVEPALADPGGGDLRLHRPRRALRELRPPADDPVDAALGRRRRAARAADQRQRPRRDRHHRHHPPDRHRQEERDHDDRLRDRGRAHREASRRARRSTRRRCCASGRS